MRFIALILLIAALTIGAYYEKNPLGQKPEPAADIVFKNGNIYTVNDDKPNAEAIAAKYGKIVFVGSNADVKKFEVKGVKVVDLKGATVVPGMADSHYHFSGVGFREMNLNLEGTTSLEDFLSKVKARVDKSGKWKAPIVTEITAAKPTDFERAPAEHQDYLQKHPGGYTCHYLRNWTI